MQSWMKHTVTAEQAGQTVREVLTGPMGISGRMIQRLTRSRGLEVNRRPAWLTAKLKAGDVVSARVAEDEEGGLPPVEMPLAIAYEDAEVIVADKPPFLLVHPTAPEHDRTLAHGIAWHLAQQGVRARVRPVHRVDRDTSGLVLFARTAHAQHRLDAQMRDGAVQREYLALVDGTVAEEEGVIDAPIARDPRNPSLRIIHKKGDPAVTRFAVEERFPTATLVRLRLETGRTHQIRVHMRHLGHAVLGDRQYGRRGLETIGRQALHAARLAFPHPASGETIDLASPLPEDFRSAIAALNDRAG